MGSTQRVAVRHSRLVLGTVQLGVEYGTGHDRAAPTDAILREVLVTARALGIGQLDTARAYGSSEERIGAARAQPDAAGLGLITKIRPLDDMSVHAAPAEIDHAVRHSAAESLRALHTAFVDALLLHRAADATRGSGAAIAALESLVESNVAGGWGISVSSPEELTTALGYPSLSYVQLPFNVLDRRWLTAPIQDALRTRPDVHITVRSALLQGILAHNAVRRWPSIDDVDPERFLAMLHAVTDSLGRVDTLDLCVNYVLGQPWVGSIVLGARRPSQVEQLAEACTRDPLSAAEIEFVHRELPAGPVDLVDPNRWPPIPQLVPDSPSQK